MLSWRPIEERFGGGESCFGLNFREEYPDIARLLSGDDGMYVNGKTATVDGYTYKAKIVNKRDGSGTLIFVEKRKAVAAQPQPQNPAPAPKPAEVPKDPIRMTTLEFDTHIQALARQFVGYLNQLAPYTAMTVTFSKKEGRA